VTGAVVAADVEMPEDDLDRYVAEQSADPAFAGAYEDAATRESLVRSLLCARHDAGLTQAAVASRMGTTQSAISELEAGVADARFSTLQRYARAAGCRLAVWVATRSEGGDEALAAFVATQGHLLGHVSSQLPNSIERTVNGQAITMQFLGVAPAPHAVGPQIYFMGRVIPSDPRHSMPGSTFQQIIFTDVRAAEPVADSPENFTISKVSA
jgi:transcriptional regulator with XRE-family HTH domain